VAVINGNGTEGLRGTLAKYEAGGHIMDTSDDFVELFRTTDPARLMVIKSVLDSAEIPYLVQGEESLWQLSWGISGSLFQPSSLCAILFVPPKDLESARVLLDDPEEEPSI
jgi:hypothetical protein